MPAPDPAAKRLKESLHKPVADLHLRGRRHAKFVEIPLSALRRTVGWIAEVTFGRGIETSKLEVELEHFHPERVTYQPSGWLFLRRGLRRGEVDPSGVFVDFGAGKGRVLCQAARYPFARVIGVEISPTLASVARANLERRRHQFACADVEVVCADVLEFEIPEEMTVAYLYHPFAGRTFETVIDRIVESLEHRPRRLTIIYACPALGEYITSSGHFRLLRSSAGGIHDPINRRVSVYMHNPKDTTLA